MKDSALPFRLKNDPTSKAGIREAARKGYNIVEGIKKAVRNPHTARADRLARNYARVCRNRLPTPKVA